MTDKETTELDEEFEDPKDRINTPRSPEVVEDGVTEEWIGEDDWGEEEEGEELFEEIGPSYVDNGDGTISDTRNNLMWTKTDSYAEFGYGITWYEALDFCESLNEKKFAGNEDWRLCSFDEAKILFSFTKSNRDKDGAEIHIDELFEPAGGHNTWTYDEKPDYGQYAMKFSYVTGNEVWENKDNEFSHVRLVRDVAKDDYEPEWRTDTKKFDR